VEIQLTSFGFKYGKLPDLDLCFDARFLANPYYVDELKPLSGLDPRVYDFVFSHLEAQQFAEQIAKLLKDFLPHYKRDGRCELVVAIGCTGGRHRSPALVEKISQILNQEGISCYIQHRDIDKA